MGKIVMPKNSALLNEIEAVLKIYYEENNWLSNDIYKSRLKELIGDEQYSSSYTKKAQITSYFGFTVWQDIKNSQSPRRITEAGKRMYKAIEMNNQAKVQSELMSALESVKFGRDNYGCPESDSDIEPPALYIRAIIDLEYVTYKEFAFLLWKLEDIGANYTDTINELKSYRTTESLELDSVAIKYADCKPIMILVRWGFLSEDEESSGSKHIIIANDVKHKYWDRLRNLKIYNIDMNVNRNDKFQTRISLNNIPYNNIYFGAPGTGKSHKLDVDAKQYFNENNIERVTFYPNYSFSQFVGTYKPIMIGAGNNSMTSEDRQTIEILSNKNKSAQEKYDLLYEKFKDNNLTRLPLLLGLYNDDDFHTKKQDGSQAIGDNGVERNHGKAIRPFVNLIENTNNGNEIAYKYVPGPFIRTLVKAIKNPEEDHLLIIEELNRANAAAVFGDMFQLLDRKSDGTSQYPVATSEDLKQHLQDNGIDNIETIALPSNFYIWTTMNSADQGVFPLDTAFKRRWDFEYLDIDENEGKITGLTFTLNGNTYSWNELRQQINNRLLRFRVNEDKLLGPFFISPSIFDDNDTFKKVFKSKVIMYLFEDAARQSRNDFFKCENKTYSSICREFEKVGAGIFDIELSPLTSNENVEILEEDE